MATTTKSTSKKTTKKSAAKSTKKAKVTKKTASKSPVTKSKSVESKNQVTSKKVESVKKPTVADKFAKLIKWNWTMAVLHAVQAVAVIVLAKDALFPVSTNYITLDSLASTDAEPILVSATRHLFDVNLAYVVAAFFIMSALAHLYIVTVYKKKYTLGLEKGINKVRWYEYGISASTMMLAIAMLSGVADLSTLVMVFGGTLVMNLCGLIMEVHNQTTQKTNWLSYIIGTIAGLGPWIVVGIYFWGATVYGTGIPTFVYFIYASIFVFFSSFAVNMYLQYKKKGKWADYLYGEKVYMILSLVAKSALAWQVFAGTLRP